MNHVTELGDICLSSTMRYTIVRFIEVMGWARSSFRTYEHVINIEVSHYVRHCSRKPIMISIVINSSSKSCLPSQAWAEERFGVMLLYVKVMRTRSHHSDYVMTYRLWLPSKQKWKTLSYYDLSSIGMLLGNNKESIAMLQGTKAEKVFEVPRWLTILIMRLIEVILVVFPPIEVSS